MVPVTIPTISGDKEGNKQIETQKLPVPHGSVLFLGSDLRTSPVFKGKRPMV